MKKTYVSPETLVLSLAKADVICSSPDSDQPYENDPGFPYG